MLAIQLVNSTRTNSVRDLAARYGTFWLDPAERGRRRCVLAPPQQASSHPPPHLLISSFEPSREHLSSLSFTLTFSLRQFRSSCKPKELKKQKEGKLKKQKNRNKKEDKENHHNHASNESLPDSGRCLPYNLQMYLDLGHPFE